MTVNLTRIYTKLGDGGETHLGDMSRVRKTDGRIEAYGDVDELGAHLGFALTLSGLPEHTAQWLRRIQNDLFDLGADLSVPAQDGRERLRLLADQVDWLEQRCEEGVVLSPLFFSFGPPPRRRVAARVPHRVPPSRAPRRLTRRAGQPADAPLPEPTERSAVHPGAGGKRRR
jgi:cob(I)alamin adenosyltransferase